MVHLLAERVQVALLTGGIRARVIAPWPQSSLLRSQPVTANTILKYFAELVFELPQQPPPPQVSRPLGKASCVYHIAACDLCWVGNIWSPVFAMCGQYRDEGSASHRRVPEEEEAD